MKPGMRVSLLNVRDETFRAGLRLRAGEVTEGEARPESDMIFVGVEGPADLESLAALKGRITRSGAVWAVFRKGRKAFNENHILAGGLAAGLVDVKVVRFSDTLSATKFVIRRSER